jgi:hypothetical protein
MCMLSSFTSSRLKRARLQGQRINDIFLIIYLKLPFSESWEFNLTVLSNYAGIPFNSPYVHFRICLKLLNFYMNLILIWKYCNFYSFLFEMLKTC